MANRDAPMGFMPVAMLDGSAIPVRRYPLLSSHIIVAVGDVIEVVAGGTVDVDDLPGTAPRTVIGVAVGLLDSDQNSAGHPNSTISTNHIAASTGGFVDVALAVPNAVFRAQSSGSIVATDRFAGFDTDTYVAPDTNTSQSKLELNSTAVTGAANWVVIDKVDEPGNDFGTNVQLLVLRAESYFRGVGDLAGV